MLPGANDSQSRVVVRTPSATSLLANLNELEHITKSIKRLSINIPDGIEETTKNLNVEMGVILEKINENEDIKKLKNISNKV